MGRRDREQFKKSLIEKHGLDFDSSQDQSRWLDSLLVSENHDQGDRDGNEAMIKGKRQRKGLGIGVRFETFHKGQ